MADVVFPSAASWCETEGTVTNSERRVQRVRKALEPPGEARDDMWIIAELARRLGHDWPRPGRRGGVGRAALALADARRHELRPARGARRPPVAVPGRGAPGLAVPARAALGGAARGPAGAVLASSRRSGPFEALDADYPIRLTTGRRLESYNTGAQTNLYRSPLHRGESLDLSPEDAERLELADGEIVARLLAPRLGRGAGPDRPVAAARARVHDVPLPGPGRHEPAHDRRHRPEVAARPSSRRPRSGSRSSRRAEQRGARRRRRAGRPWAGRP